MRVSTEDLPFRLSIAAIVDVAVEMFRRPVDAGTTKRDATP
jgi:hypothetical protein